MLKLLDLIRQLYGSKIFSKTLGTRTNVIKLPSKEKKRLAKNDFDIDRASDEQVLMLYEEGKELVEDLPKLNDMEKMTLEANLRRLARRLGKGETVEKPSAEVFDIGTKKPVSKSGIEQLAAERGLPEGVEEGSIMGKLTRAAQKMRQRGSIEGMVEEQQKAQSLAKKGLMRSAVRYKMLEDMEKGILKLSDEEAAMVKGEKSGKDMLEIWLDNYGPDAMEVVDEIAPEFSNARSPKDLVMKIEQNVDARPLTAEEKADMAANQKAADKIRKEYEGMQAGDEIFDEPEDFATGGRVGFNKGGEVPVITLDDKIDEMIAFYKKYLKKGGKMNFTTFAKKYIPENFATGGRAGYGKGGAVKEGIKALIEKINKKFGKGTVKLGKDIKRPESAEMREAFLEFKKRQGFAYGSGKKLVQVLKTLGKDLKKEIKKAVDDLIPSGDPKLDADMAVDNMLEDLNIDRDTIDGYDILDAYGLAYDEIKKPLLQKLKNKPKPSPKTADEVKKEAVEKYGIKPERADEIMNTEFDEEKILADVDEAYGVTPDMKKELDQMKELGASKMAERFELKQKYPGIDDKLLTQIIDDPDPQRKAEVLATIDQAFELMKQGKSPDEVLDIMKQMTDRTKQAGGGLAYLMGL